MRDSFRKYINDNRKVILFGILFTLVLIFALVIIVPRTIFLDISKKDVGLSSEKTDFGKQEAGAWNVIKSAKWTAKGEAEIIFDVESILKSSSKNTDVIFVLDVSSSMDGEKLDRVKAGTVEVINTLLTNEMNRAGLITFGTNSQIVSELTNNNDELIGKINSLIAAGKTNYYQALVNVDLILKNYVKEDSRECVVLFLTDGYPDIDTPNEQFQYTYLKKQYPFININGLQYEAGNSIISSLKNVSDKQYIAHMDDLASVLLEASINVDSYDKFEITDYINTNYFYVENETNIKVSQGRITFDKDDQKVTWNIDNFKSGTKAKLAIKIKLKGELGGAGSTYPTNERVEIKSKIGEVTEVIESTETPFLKDNYKVVYDGNEPSGCKVEGVPEEREHTVFDTVELSDSVLKCEGYQFKGWKITTKNVKKVNDGYFVMPDTDVEIKATWSKLRITKSMEGEVSEVLTLYKQVKADYENNNHARLYTGDTSTFNGEENVYYYYGDTPNNNVIFGDFCWRMVRTTDTGGVKMVYNGVSDSDGKCGSDRENHVGYDTRTIQPLSSSYMYGTEYTYDDAAKTFILSGETETVTWSNSTSGSLIGKYTCKNTTGRCSSGSLYLIESYNSNTEANVLPINNTTIYSQIGVSAFNSSSSSLADVGYMYNKRYTYSSKRDMNTAGDYMYGNSFKYEYNDETGEYEYRLNGETQHFDDWNSNYSKLGNTHYTCWNASGTCKTLSYIYHIYSDTPYYINLENGTSIEKAIDEMLYAQNVNTTNSPIKSVIDAWYSKNMMEYTDYLEDTVWCNDRSMSNQSSNGWNPNGGSNSTYLYF